MLTLWVLIKVFGLIVAVFRFLNGDETAISRYIDRNRERRGFEALSDARGKFDVRFYLVAILFIIFDLEIAFLFPWAVSLREIGTFGFWSMMVFLGVLTVGFIYEWKKGGLEWE